MSVIFKEQRMSSNWLWHNEAWQEEQGLNLADRALHYGDGLFETLRRDGQHGIPLWGFHLERLREGLDALFFPSSTLERLVVALAALPKAAKRSGGKLIISRGVAERGYVIPQEAEATFIWQAFAAPSFACARFPQGFQADISPVRLGNQPRLAGIKHLNRLEQVLIRQHFAPNCQEMLVLNQDGQVVEGAMSNVFWWQDGKLHTPKLDLCGVNGVVRRWLLTLHDIVEAQVDAEVLLAAQGVFFCNSLNGIIPVQRLAHRQYSQDFTWQQSLALQHELERLF